ncbi:MAG: DUF86 domain-containing protein [Caldilineaceae bacterium]|nr:DUF86 domain-containing protein [Caldilineaceae bacterium]
MSETDREARSWRFYIQDMIDFSEKVLAYTEGLDQEAFLADGLTYDATMRNLQLIGEAATHIPGEIREAHSEIPWHAIIGTRNRLAHSYLTISDRIIWGIIQEAVPDLLPALRSLLESTSGKAK